MVPCGIFETRIASNLFLKFGSICYVINFGILHYKIWKFYIQSKYIRIDILNILHKQIHPVVYFLPVTIVQKQEKDVNLFVSIARVY